MRKEKQVILSIQHRKQKLMSVWRYVNIFPYVYYMQHIYSIPWRNEPCLMLTRSCQFQVAWFIHIYLSEWGGKTYISSTILLFLHVNTDVRHIKKHILYAIVKNIYLFNHVNCMCAGVRAFIALIPPRAITELLRKWQWYQEFNPLGPDLLTSSWPYPWIPEPKTVNCVLSIIPLKKKK